MMDRRVTLLSIHSRKPRLTGPACHAWLSLHTFPTGCIQPPRRVPCKYALRAEETPHRSRLIAPCLRTVSPVVHEPLLMPFKESSSEPAHFATRKQRHARTQRARSQKSSAAQGARLWRMAVSDAGHCITDRDRRGSVHGGLRLASLFAVKVVVQARIPCTMTHPSVHDAILLQQAWSVSRRGQLSTGLPEEDTARPPRLTSSPSHQAKKEAFHGEVIVCGQRCLRPVPAKASRQRQRRREPHLSPLRWRRERNGNFRRPESFSFFTRPAGETAAMSSLTQKRNALGRGHVPSNYVPG